MGSEARVAAPDSNTGNVIRDSALGLVPETLEHYLPLNAAVWDDGALSAAEIEMARLRNAGHTGCAFCQAVRYDVAIADGLEEDTVTRLRGDIGASGLSEREQLILRFVDQYALDPGGMPAELQAALQEHFSAAELMHLSLLVAYFNGFSRCAVALGGMPDEMPRMEISVPR